MQCCRLTMILLYSVILWKLRLMFGSLTKSEYACIILYDRFFVCRCYTHILCIWCSEHWLDIHRARMLSMQPPVTLGTCAGNTPGGVEYIVSFWPKLAFCIKSILTNTSRYMLYANVVLCVVLLILALFVNPLQVIPNSYQKYVDQHRNCEDLAMAYVVAVKVCISRCLNSMPIMWYISLLLAPCYSPNNRLYGCKG